MEMNLIMAQPQDAVTTVTGMAGTISISLQQGLISDETSIFAGLLQNAGAKTADAGTGETAVSRQNGDPVAMQFTQILTVTDHSSVILSQPIQKGSAAETASARPMPVDAAVGCSPENQMGQRLEYPSLPQQQSRLAYTLQEMRKITLDELQPAEPQKKPPQAQFQEEAPVQELKPASERLLETASKTVSKLIGKLPAATPKPDVALTDTFLADSGSKILAGKQLANETATLSAPQQELQPKLREYPKSSVRGSRNNTAEIPNPDPLSLPLSQLQAVTVHSPIVLPRPESRNEEQKTDTMSEEQRNTVKQQNTSAEQSPKPAPASETGLPFISAIQSIVTPAAETVTGTEAGIVAQGITEPALEAMMARPRYLPPKERPEQAADSTMMAEVRPSVDPLLKNTVKQVADQTDPTDSKQASPAAKPVQETTAKPFTPTPSGQNPTQLSGSESLSAKEVPATTAVLPSPVRNDLLNSEPVEETVALNHPALASRAQKITERSQSLQTAAPIITEAAAPLQRQTGGTNSAEGSGPSISHEFFGKISTPGSSRPAGDDNDQNKNEPGKDQSAAANSLPLPGASAKTEPGREAFQVKAEEPANPLHKNILDQLKEGIVTHDSKGNGRMSIRLNPADLGELQVNVRMDEHRVKVEIISDNRTVREALMGNLDTLKETLSKQNLSMEGFHVSTSAGEGFSQAFREETGAHRNALRLARNLEQKSPDLPRQSVSDDS
ncbi:MAG: flagellar hook-length control protein FliK, partial [Deltaproteobacteria bacterium]|nr:flagellar hook-length control protein FliK [Deltaproteobacteria bacterium]